MRCDQCEMPPHINEGSATRCAWLSPTVVAIAEEIRKTQSFEEMPILADALEDAGCTEESILKHLRGSQNIKREVITTEYCPKCGKKRDGWRTDIGMEHEALCLPCKISWAPFEDAVWYEDVPLSGLHCRECWVLCLMLGR